ncbi:hypothetical protein DUNSADRAFT_8640 [Dunaliella salina]|nr:hypothetical protein DUNSADRAFT_8640 [Dunaliella salina]|eukprot:KAF5834632.1 hypothetical protein DUNSADRAFT_8640 [Dunaliella salina]
MPVDEASGWIGDKCDQEVHMLPANGTAAKASLNPDETKCWATRLSSHGSPTANFFSIMGSLAKNSSAVDLHGLVAIPTAWHVNASLKYPNSSMDWDYSNSLKPGPLARLQLLGDAAQHSQRFGLYLCATPQKDSQPTHLTAGQASIMLSAKGHACMDDCNNWRGGQQRGTCQEDGRCACEAHWLGATCDVAAPNTTSTKCVPGSTLPEHTKDSTAPGNFECQKKKKKCGPSTELSCEEGTLRQDFTFQGGSVYGVCVCGPAAKARAGLALRAPEGPNCTFTSPLPPPSPKEPVKPEGGVVMCSPGHELLNAKPNSIVLSNGRKLQGGGRCVPITHIHK